MYCFNYNKLVADLILKILFLTLEVVKTKYCYQPAGHIVTGDLKIINDSRIRSIIFMGPKHRFLLPIDFKLVVRKLQASFKSFVIASVNESMFGLML